MSHRLAAGALAALLTIAGLSTASAQSSYEDPNQFFADYVDLIRTQNIDALRRFVCDNFVVEVKGCEAPVNALGEWIAEDKVTDVHELKEINLNGFLIERFYFVEDNKGNLMFGRLTLRRRGDRYFITSAYFGTDSDQVKQRLGVDF